jgi:hypothetical protein
MRAVLALATILLAGAAGGVAVSGHASSTGCAATTVRYGPSKHPTLNDLPWVLAKPQAKAVIGWLVSYPRTLRDQRVNESDGLVLWQTGEKVVWGFQSGRATLVARRLDGPGSLRIPLTKTSAGLVSAPRFPSIGCWRLSLGGATVVVKVVQRPSEVGCAATAAAEGLTLARPRSSGLAGGFPAQTDDGRLMFYTHGVSPSGMNMKVPWWSRNGHGLLRLTGIRLDVTGRFEQQFQEAGTSQFAPGYHAVFPSIVDVPAAGCWLLRLRLGLHAGIYVVRAIDG